MNEPGRRHRGGGRRRGHSAGGAWPERRRRIERGLLRWSRPHAPRPSSRRRLPWRPVLAAAGRGGAPLLEGSAAVGRRRGGRPRGAASPRAARVCAGRSGRPRPAVAGHSAPRGGRGRGVAERPAGVCVRASPSRISHDRKLEAVSRKRAFTARPCVVPGGTWLRGTGSKEPAAATVLLLLLLQPRSWAGALPTPPAANRLGVRAEGLAGSAELLLGGVHASVGTLEMLICYRAPHMLCRGVRVKSGSQNTPKRGKVITSTCHNYRELFTHEVCLLPIFPFVTMNINYFCSQIFKNQMKPQNPSFSVKFENPFSSKGIWSHPGHSCITRPWRQPRSHLWFKIIALEIFFCIVS